jgi:hypothetical protein
MSAAERNGYFTRPSKSSVACAEETAWVGFYKRIGDPAVAEEVIKYLDADQEEKRQHPALYLRAKESVRRNEYRQERARRIGNFARAALSIAVVSPVKLIANLLREGRQIAVECLPEAGNATITKEPARRRVRKLATEYPEFAEANKAFVASSPPNPLQAKVV